MILSNVNIGTGPSAGDGDPLRSAFSTINTNFQIVTNNVNALTNSVTSVAGRTGNVVLTINDILGINVYASNSAVNSANIGMRGYVDATVSANIAALVDLAPNTLDTIRELADAIGDDPNFAVNVALSVSSANTKMRSYVDGQITAANTASATANVGMTGYVNQANITMKGYVDGQITAANVGVTSANLGLKGYVDQANTIQSAQVGAANLAIIAANLGMKGYVDSVAGGSYSNVNTLAYLTTNSYATQAFVNQANTSLKVYTDGQVTAANTAVVDANIGMLGYVFQSNATLRSYVDGQITAANAGVASANLGMKGYVDSVASQSIYGNANVNSYLTGGFDGNIIPSANVTYSLGNITHQWKELWVSNSTVYIGGAALSVVNRAGNEIGLSIEGNLILTGLGDETVAIGRYAGGINYGGGVTPYIYGDQGEKSVAVGPSAGKMSQGANCIAVGSSAGGEYQGNADTSLGIGGAIAIGGGSGIENQGYHSVSIGYYPAQGAGSGGNVSLEYFRGQTLQGNGAVSLGAYAGASNQGDNAVAIGYRAGISSQHSNSIVINASGNDLDANVAGLHINPVRRDDSNVANVVYYNTATSELTYGPAASSSYSNVQVATYLPTYTGNISAGNLVMTNNVSGIIFSTGSYIQGNTSIANRGGSLVLQPNTAASSFAGVIIGGAGRILSPSGFVNIINGDSAVTLQAPTTVSSATASTNSTTGALVVTGGVGIGGNLNIGSGNLFVQGNIIARDITGGNVTATRFIGNVRFPDNSVQTTAYINSVNTAAISANVLTLDFSLTTQIVTHDANISNVAISNGPGNLTSKSMTVILTQDATGGRTISGYYKTQDGLGLDIDTTALAVNIYTFLAVNNGSTTDLYAFSNGTNFI